MAKTTSFILLRFLLAQDQVEFFIFRALHKTNLRTPCLIPEVPVPSDFGLVYEEVVLETSDHIRVRAFVMVQKVNIEHATPVHVEGSSQPTDDEVRDNTLHY